MSDTESSGAHHGPPFLTKADVNLCLAVSLWIETVRKANPGDSLSYGPDWLPTHPDILKSRLFWRIRSGKQPLPHPPPTCFSCPWYEVVEEVGPHSSFDGGVHRWDPAEPEYLVIAQDRYTILERDADDVPKLVGYGPWKFRVWRAPAENKARHNTDRPDDWYIQNAEFAP